MTEPILVTGGAGFIGSHLVDRLIADGSSVTVLDDFSTGHEANLDGHPSSAQLRVVRGSVTDEALVDRLVADHPLVFHLAAAVGVAHIMSDPVGALRTNVRGTENVLAAAHRHGSRVVLASTSEIYGRSSEVPFEESANRVLGPTWIHRWSYSTSKAVDEHLAFAYAEQGLRVSIVRYFNSYGPRIDERGYGSVIARFVAQALSGEPITVQGDGNQTRSFTYVTDTVEGTVLAARRKEALGNVFNIGSTQEVTILNLAERIRDRLGSASPITLVPYEAAYPTGFQDTRRRVPDLSRARELLGFSPTVSLDEGLARTLAWCSAHYAAAGELR
jgi:nucleoside-diphosphate-sugar epimerase